MSFYVITVILIKYTTNLKACVIIQMSKFLRNVDQPIEQINNIHVKKPK